VKKQRPNAPAYFVSLKVTKKKVFNNVTPGSHREVRQGLQRHKERLFAVEVDEEHHRVLLYVEDHRPVCSAKEDQSHGGREQAQAGLRPGIHQQDDQVKALLD
jgi:hypothetical protein